MTESKKKTHYPYIAIKQMNDTKKKNKKGKKQVLKLEKREHDNRVHGK